MPTITRRAPRTSCRRSIGGRFSNSLREGVILVAGAEPMELGVIVSHQNGPHLLSDRHLPGIVLAHAVCRAPLAHCDSVCVNTMDALPGEMRQIVPDDLRLIGPFKDLG